MWKFNVVPMETIGLSVQKSYDSIHNENWKKILMFLIDCKLFVPTEFHILFN